MLQQKQLKILLIGDSCTDEYVYGTCERLNPEAPVPILKFNKKVTTKGMAWNVKKNLESFSNALEQSLVQESKIIDLDKISLDYRIKKILEFIDN